MTAEMCGGWLQVALSVLDSLTRHDLSPELARDWLKMLLDYAEAL